MNLAELKEAYKARKLALDSAKKEEEKYKALLKDAMLEAGESDYTDEAGYRFVTAIASCMDIFSSTV